LPSCTLGEKQVAGIKFEWGHYYGKVINSVERSGRQRTSVELLTEEWIQKDTDESFRKILTKKLSIWVPVGEARPDSYPYEYDKKLPPIAFPQDNRNTCVTSSFASCLYYGITSGKLIPSATNAHLFKNPPNFLLILSSLVMIILYLLTKTNPKFFNHCAIS
jgi:hypothetical protein